MKTCIAVDVGGTKMLVAEVREDGTVVNLKKYPTGQSGRGETVNRLIQGVREYEREIGWENGERPRQMGVGINGVVDPERGVWKAQEPGDEEIPLAERLEKEFQVKCYVDNDVKSTVIAENIFGAGRGCRDMIYINVGTGLAAGIIVNGKVVRGTDGFAGEIGFMNFTEGNGVRVEMLASGMGMGYQARELLEQYPDSLLNAGPGKGICGKDVFDMADRGDRLANLILDRMIRMNALMISNLTCVLSPEIVILGGGLITNERLLERITEAVTPKSRAHLEKGVAMTGLDPAYAGLIGAAAIGLGHQQRFL